MTRLIVFLLTVLVIASGLAWLADRPGNLLITWEGYEVETSVFRAVVILAVVTGLCVLAWSIIRQVWAGPAAVSHFLTRRRQRRGLDALSSGMIAIGAGDRTAATRHAIQARRALPNEPMTHLLRAQAAQLSGDRATARRIFEAMLASTDTEQLGLRGLYLEAMREGEPEAARQFADRALRLNPKLGWPYDALFELQVKARDWPAATETLATARRNGSVEKMTGDRQRAVLLTAQAQALEDSDADKALALASEAHALAPDLIPAAAIAGRILAGKGQTARAAKIIHKTWSRAPHPDLAAAYAYARIGDSTRDRLDRIKKLAAMKPHDIESTIAVATTALEGRAWDEARLALQPWLGERLTRRIARLMARLEAEEHGDAGRTREWLVRAATAERDPAWTADGVVLESWAPVSPVSGALDAVRWRVPVTGPEAGMGPLAEAMDWDAIAAAGGESRAPTIDATPATQRETPRSAGATAIAADGATRAGGTAANGSDTAVTTDPLLHAPDDPGSGGETLVPEIRTSRTSVPPPR